MTVNTWSQSISEVRKLKEGEKATVSGIVTNGNELGVIRYIQDSTGGLAIYDEKLDNVKRGDSITVSGKVESYNNLFEIVSITSLTIHSSNHQLPNPKVITIGQIGEDYEGQLVEIKDVEIDGNGNFGGNKNYDISVGTASSEIRINTNSPIVGQIIPTEKINLTAICSQFSFETNDTRNGYQLLPRDMNDLISEGNLSFTSPIQVSDINQNGFTLSWSTNVEVEPAVSYRIGYSEDLSLKESFGTSQQAGEEYYNSVEITGLSPANFVYAKALCSLENDIIQSEEIAFITESNSSGSIKAYFNTPVNESLAKENIAQNIGNALEDTLIAYINRTQISIDFCMYNFSNSGLSDVSEALNNAHKRGVRVRVITCGSTSHSGADDLISEIEVLERPEEDDNGIMHNKFIVFDADPFQNSFSNQQNQWVCTGSTNLTYNQVNTDANHMIFIQDKSLALTYLTEFEEMWGSTSDSPNPDQAKFGEEKTDNTPHELLIGGNRVQCYFSPSDNTNQKIINAINTADHDLNVQTMLITRSDIAWAISDASKRQVEVQVLTNYSEDNTNTVNQILEDALPPQKYIFDDFAPGMLHHKMAIIDANYSASDPQVITGSHNWSNNANERNDENTLVIHHSDIANQFFQQFAYRFKENGGNLYVSIQKEKIDNVSVFPNPTSGRIQIISDKNIQLVKLYSSKGDLIFAKELISNGNSIDISEQSHGIYLLTVIFENGEHNIYKVIKTQ